MQASISPAESGNMITFEPLHMMEMLDTTEKLDGFAQRLRELGKQKNLSQTDLGQLADDDKNVVKKLLDAFLTKKRLQAPAL